MTSSVRALDHEEPREARFGAERRTSGTSFVMSYFGGGMSACTTAFMVAAGKPLLASSMPIERPSREWRRACTTRPSR